MQERTGDSRRRGRDHCTGRSAAAAILLLAGVMLAGCASGFETGLLFADAGKYQFHNCEQLAAAAKQTSAREQQLKGLIDKAEQDAGGVIVSAMAYRTDYIAATEELRVIRSEQRNKSCPAVDPPQ
jgi:hypothetical protein